jgi:hypothetical protein
VAALNRAPADQPLDLSVPLADLPASANFRLEIVTLRGKTVWSGAAAATGSTLSVHVATKLGKATYWVRLYSSSELLAEYGLKLD